MTHAALSIDVLHSDRGWCREFHAECRLLPSNLFDLASQGKGVVLLRKDSRAGLQDLNNNVRVRTLQDRKGTGLAMSCLSGQQVGSISATPLLDARMQFVVFRRLVDST